MSDTSEYVFELSAFPVTGSASQMFCESLLHAYMKWCDRQRYKVQIVSLRQSEWGISQLIALIEGDCQALEAHSGRWRLLADSSLYTGAIIASGTEKAHRIYTHTAEVRWYPSALDDIDVKFERKPVGAGGGIDRHSYLKAIAPTSEVILTQAQGQSWLELEAIANRILAGRAKHPALAFSDKLTLHCRLYPVAHSYCHWQTGDKALELSQSDYQALLEGVFPL